jgi:predicted GNAT family acetyltransferase
MVRVTITASAEEFAARAGELLASRIEHNVLATVLQSVRFRPRGSPVFAYVEDPRGAVVAAALRTPPRRMLASAMEARIAEALIDAWLEQDPALPGVGAPRAVARALARAWEARTGGAAILAVAEALHTLERVRDPARPARGQLRLAGGEDRELLVEWMRAFAFDVGQGEAIDAPDSVGRGLDRGLLYVWDDADPVALVGHAPAVDGVARIGPVYTPPPRRSHGYASNAVAALSRALLDAGARRCMLYTDLANPTSNRIYAALGYRRMARWEEISFARGARAAQNPPPS